MASPLLQVCDWDYSFECGGTPQPETSPSQGGGGSDTSPQPLPSLAPYSPTPFSGDGIYAMYYDTWGDPWKGTAAAHTLANLPSYINVVYLSFM